MQWVEFLGRAQRLDHGWLLNPIEDKQVAIELAPPDVRMRDATIEVRVGAKAQVVSIPAESPLNLMPKRESRPTCAGGKSRCAGGVEWCCDDKVAGGCSGWWNDCGRNPKP